MIPSVLNSITAWEHEGGEFRRVNKQGQPLWLQATYNPVFGADGQQTGVVKFASDITAQKTKAADDEGKINAISRSQAVIEFNTEGIIQSANENFLAATGYTLDEIVGQHHRMFCDSQYAETPEY